MAAGKINLQKASGGVAAITVADGATNTSVVLPESGTMATTAYVDNKKDINYKATPISITSWSYSGTTITLNVASHTFVAGDHIEVSGLTATTNAANGILLVTSVTATTIVFTLGATPTGTAGVSSATVKGYATVNGRVIDSLTNLNYVDVKANRAIGSTYYNTSGKPKVVSISSYSSSGGTCSFTISGSRKICTTQSPASYDTNVYGIVPNGESYTVSWTGGTITVTAWMEA